MVDPKMMDKTMFHDNAAVADLLNSSVIPLQRSNEHDFRVDIQPEIPGSRLSQSVVLQQRRTAFDRLLGYDDNTANFVSTLKEVLSGDQQDTYGYDAKELSMPWPDFTSNRSGKKTAPGSIRRCRPECLAGSAGETCCLN